MKAQEVIQEIIDDITHAEECVELLQAQDFIGFDIAFFKILQERRWR